MSGRVVFDKFTGEFELLFDFKFACAKVPNFSYADNMELRVLAHDMVVADFSNLNIGEQFNNMDQLNISNNHEDIKEYITKGVSTKDIFYDKMLFLNSLVKKFCYLITIL